MLYQYSLMHLRCGTPPNLSTSHSRGYKKQPLHGYTVHGTTTEHDRPDSKYSISMYMELHDFMFLLSVINGNYDIKSSTIPNFKSTETRQSKGFEVPKQRLRKWDENFCTRATRLYNIKRKTTDKPLSKKLLTQMSYFFFTDATMNLTAAAGESCATVETVTPLKNLC